MAYIFRLLRGALRHAWRRLGIVEHHLLHTWGVLLRTTRLCLGPVLGLRKQVLLLDSPAGFSAGLFAELGAVLGMLEHYEHWQARYAGVRVDFGHRGLYHDPAVGANWWAYYFETVDLPAGGTAAPVRVVDTCQHIGFSVHATQRLDRVRGHALLNRYIRVKPHIQRAVDDFVRTHFTDAPVIGVHYRGTDKAEEAPRVAYPAVLAAVRAQLAAAGTADCRVFVATDEQAFLDWMRSQLPDKLIYSEVFRSPDGHPAHVGSPDMHKRGEEAVIDCLLLSRCQALIRTPSNLGLCATLFNPALPTTLLTSP